MKNIPTLEETKKFEKKVQELIKLNPNTDMYLLLTAISFSWITFEEFIK